MVYIRSDLSKEFGLSLGWNPKDRDEIRRFNKNLWNEFRRKYFEEHEEEIKERLLREGRSLTLLSPHHFPNVYISGFLESIQSLHIDYGCSFTDIGVDFGLTKESIRQHFEEYGLRRRKEFGSMPMVWNGKKIFVPITGRGLEKILIEKDGMRKKEEREKIKLEQSKAIRDFRKKRGREPNLRELSESLGYIVVPNSRVRKFSILWGYDPRKEKNATTESGAIDNLYRAAGSKERPGRGRGIKSLV